MTYEYSYFYFSSFFSWKVFFCFFIFSCLFSFIFPLGEASGFYFIYDGVLLTLGSYIGFFIIIYFRMVNAEKIMREYHLTKDFLIIISGHQDEDKTFLSLATIFSVECSDRVVYVRSKDHGRKFHLKFHKKKSARHFSRVLNSKVTKIS